MAHKITAQLIRQMVGVRAGVRPLIDKLVDPLNLVLPAYGITTEFRVAAFLATCAPESDWFKTLREYGKGAGRKYGRAIKGLVYYGRGIFQVTWLDNYREFTEFVIENWAAIKPRARKYGYTTPPNFVTDPELLATPYWAVEAACWYWQANGLQKHADRGLKGFFALQGLVNRGSATKKALHYEARLNSYEVARRVLPDDLDISAADQSQPLIDEPAVDPPAVNAEEPVPPAPNDELPADTQPPTQIADNIINTGDQSQLGEGSNVPVNITAPPPEGTTAANTKLTVLGFTVPTFAVAGVTAIKSAVSEGYISAAELGSTVIGFITANQKYVFGLIGLVIIGSLLNKAYKQISFFIEVLTRARQDLNAVNIVPSLAQPPAVKKPWYKVW